ADPPQPSLRRRLPRGTARPDWRETSAQALAAPGRLRFAAPPPASVPLPYPNRPATRGRPDARLGAGDRRRPRLPSPPGPARSPRTAGAAPYVPAAGSSPPRRGPAAHVGTRTRSPPRP